MTTARTLGGHPNTVVAAAAQDGALLLARIGLAVLMMAHARLAFEWGGGSLAGVGQLFAQGGVPLPALTGPANVLLESVGGLALILGVAVRPIAALLSLNMVGAWVLVHPFPLYAEDHTGPETVIALGLLSLLLVATGSGCFGLDHVLRRRRDTAD